MSNSTLFSSTNFALLNQSINRYVSIILLFFGIIGNILNILIFTRKIFRNNICVIYFLASTISDSFSIGIGLLTRLLNGFNIDPSQFSSIFCKLRFFITYLAAYTSAWFVSIACIERYLSSSSNVHRRQLITIKYVYLSIFVVILLGFIIFSEQFYCIDINQQLLGAPQSCYQLKQNIPCQISDSLIQFLLEMMSPALVMLVFGFLILRNIRRQHLHVNPTHLTNSLVPMATLVAMKNQRVKQQQSINIQTVSNTRPLTTEMNRTIQKRNAQLISILVIQVRKNSTK